MIARQEVICRKACAVPLATCFAASASNAATKGLTAALLSFSQIPGLLVWVSATYRRPNSFCIASLSSKSLPAAYSSRFRRASYVSLMMKSRKSSGRVSSSLTALMASSRKSPTDWILSGDGFMGSAGVLSAIVSNACRCAASSVSSRRGFMSKLTRAPFPCVGV